MLGQFMTNNTPLTWGDRVSWMSGIFIAHVWASVWNFQDEVGQAADRMDWDGRFGTSWKLQETRSLSYILHKYDNGHVVFCIRTSAVPNGQFFFYPHLFILSTPWISKIVHPSLYFLYQYKLYNIYFRPD